MLFWGFALRNASVEQLAMDVSLATVNAGQPARLRIGFGQVCPARLPNLDAAGG